MHDRAYEHEALLPTTTSDDISHHTTPHSRTGGRSGRTNAEYDYMNTETMDSSPTGAKEKSGPLYCATIFAAFAVGVICTVIVQLIAARFSPPSSDSLDINLGAAIAPPYAGESEVDQFPPAAPTNKFPSYFPSNIGYSGATPTGAEAAIAVTVPEWPMHTGAPHLVIPEESKKKIFNMLEKWGNLSPWYSIKRGGFGLDSGPEAPETCSIVGLHFLHRHGARYPTTKSSMGGPANLAEKLHRNSESWNASGQLAFLNDWTYKLGAEILTPFGRQQLFDLGVTMRLKYGFLLKNFTMSNTIPVFRTESQDRMLSSAINFALGFFGWPHDNQYQQLISIEAESFNNTLAPTKACPNSRDGTKAGRGLWYLTRWTDIYLLEAQERLQKQINGFELEIMDVFAMQQTCAYETVALGYSKFCELFTEDDWEGFDYALDVYYWYDSAFGSPLAHALGIGWIQELVARLTHTPIAVHNSSTNSTLDDNPITFPLDQSLYVDATHDTVLLNVITTLNLTRFSEQGPLPYTHIVKDRKFRSSELASFAANIQLQLLECQSLLGSQIRIIINDGVVPLTGIRGCPEHKDGICPLDAFVEAMKEIVKGTNWLRDCHGDWSVPPGTAWNTTTGEPPGPEKVLG